MKLSVSNDAFTKTTFTQTPDFQLDSSNGNQRYIFRIEHASNPNGDWLRISFQYLAGKWAIWRNGCLYLLINNTETIEIKAVSPSTQGAHVHAGGIYEHVYYYIDKNILEKICEAEILDIKLFSNETQIDMNLNGFISYARAFYNQFYDDTKYVDEDIRDEESRIGNISWKKWAIGAGVAFFFLLQMCS